MGLTRNTLAACLEVYIPLQVCPHRSAALVYWRTLLRHSGAVDSSWMRTSFTGGHAWLEECNRRLKHFAASLMVLEGYS